MARTGNLNFGKELSLKVSQQENLHFSEQGKHFKIEKYTKQCKRDAFQSKLYTTTYCRTMLINKMKGETLPRNYLIIRRNNEPSALSEAEKIE